MPRLALFHIFIMICARVEFPVCGALQFAENGIRIGSVESGN